MLKQLHRASVCLFVVIVPGSIRVPAQTILDGTWVVTTVTFNGKVSDDGRTSLSFAGEQYEQALDGIINEHGFLRLDQTKKPMTIDFIVVDGTPTNTVQLGIIEITGDTLRLHLGMKARPVDFNPTPQDLLIIAKRK